MKMTSNPQPPAASFSAPQAPPPALGLDSTSIGPPPETGLASYAYSQSGDWTVGLSITSPPRPLWKGRSCSLTHTSVDSYLLRNEMKKKKKKKDIKEIRSG